MSPLTSDKRPATSDVLMEMYRRMRAHSGYLHWWPAETPFEVIIGAILTQNTAWRNVERAIENLKRAGVLEPVKMNALPEKRLAQLIRPAGYFNVKARRVKFFLDFLFERYNGDVAKMRQTRLPRLRKELLGVNGIGEETADSILLYACGKKTFVVDAYTRRVLSRHGLANADAGYGELKSLFETNLPKRLGLYKDFHAQIVYVGKGFCGTRARCGGCPLDGCSALADYSSQSL